MAVALEPRARRIMEDISVFRSEGRSVARPVNLLHRRPLDCIGITLRGGFALLLLAKAFASDFDIAIALAVADATMPVAAVCVNEWRMRVCIFALAPAICRLRAE